MENMSDVYVLVLTALLAINAFFVRGLVGTINEVRLELVRLSAQHDNVSNRSISNAEDIKEIYKTMNNLRERIHSIEGMQPQVMKWLEEISKK